MQYSCHRCQPSVRDPPRLQKDWRRLSFRRWTRVLVPCSPPTYSLMSMSVDSSGLLGIVCNQHWGAENTSFSSAVDLAAVHRVSVCLLWMGLPRSGVLIGDVQDQGFCWLFSGTLRVSQKTLSPSSPFITSGQRRLSSLTGLVTQVSVFSFLLPSL